ncbi:hypothetical protein TKK_0014917 [Trichogramma kaykai]|uniref:SH2 domain-containing protein n=1 Tax=Trichogramma kaykai TaxID=54128 RepID=A0ABD2WD58_9HYME
MPMKHEATMSRSEALDIISNWSCSDVLLLLKKNGVGEACWKAAEKRQIDGDELLHLTEGKLALWKTDLARPHIWDLWTFVEEVKKNPEVFAQGAERQQADSSIGSEETRAESRASSSDNISWDADQVIASTPKSQTNPTGRDDDASPDFRSSLRMFQENDRRSMRADPLRSSNVSLNRRSQDKSLEESPPDGSATYANVSATVVNDQTTYANLPFVNDQTTTTKHNVEQAQEETLKNSSRLHKSGLTKSLADQLREQLEIRANRSPNKSSPAQRPDNTTDKPRESFLHCAKSNGTTGTSHTLPYFHSNRRSPVSGVASLDTSSRASQGSTSGSDGGGGGGSDQAQQLRNLPKPPPSMSLRELDLVANLPRRPTVGSDSDADAEDEEDDGEGYEAFDEQIVERHQQQRGSVVSVDSFASVRDDHGLPQQQQQPPPQQPPPPPPPDGGGLDDEEVYEIYESITESPDDENGREYINADFKVRPDPPPLPAKPPPNLTANLNNKNKTEAKSERSTENKKSATLPHTGSSSSLSSSCSNNNSNSNAARPLPPPPNRQQSYIDRPWFHNLTREQANLLIEEKGTYDNSADGYFLIRPSTTNPTNPLVLVLWCKNRVYNVPIRKRPDNKYALGSAKTEEKSFISVDEIIPYYKREKLILYSGGVQSATTYLTETPPKN